MGSATILAVDDDHAIRNMIVETLEPLGYKVIVAASGQEALKVCRVKEEKIDLLLTDVVMPGMSGRQLTKELQEARPYIKVLLMSGYPADIVGPISQLEPNFNFISKPFRPAVLSQEINRILKESSADTDEQQNRYAFPA